MIDLHMLLMCFVSNRCESIMTPRFCASGSGGIVHPLMLMSGITSELENLDVKWTISVLSRITREAVDSAPDHYVVNPQVHLG